MPCFSIKNFHAGPFMQLCGMLHEICRHSHAFVFTFNRILAFAACLALLCIDVHMGNAQCVGTGCGVVGNSVDAIMAIPARAVGYLASPSVCCCDDVNCCNNHCECASRSWCGPVGHAVDRLLAIPARLFGSLTSYGSCRGNCRGDVYYPRGSSRYCTGTVADVAPQKRVAVPSYITYSIVDERMPMPPASPVVTFSGPLVFDQ